MLRISAKLLHSLCGFCFYDCNRILLTIVIIIIFCLHQVNCFSPWQPVGVEVVLAFVLSFDRTAVSVIRTWVMVTSVLILFDVQCSLGRSLGRGSLDSREVVDREAGGFEVVEEHHGLLTWWVLLMRRRDGGCYSEMMTMTMMLIKLMMAVKTFVAMTADLMVSRVLSALY